MDSFVKNFNADDHNFINPHLVGVSYKKTDR